MRARRSQARRRADNGGNRRGSLGVRQDATMTRIEVAGRPRYPAGLRPTLRLRLKVFLTDLLPSLTADRLVLSAAERRELAAQRQQVEQLIDRDPAAYVRSRRLHVRR